jgi:predicted RNA-binding Zn ribbon-like protein
MVQERVPAFFVGNHPALDFLNTIATPQDAPVEWLTDGKDLVDWLQQAGMIGTEDVARFRGSKSAAPLDEAARRAREFRGWLRRFVTRHMGKVLRATADVNPLNDLLAEDNSFRRVEAAGNRLLLRRVQRWESAAELLQPIADAAADLICKEDFRLIRACEGSACTLLFLDKTKAHGRRWCSMAICGNRAKVAAHRARKGGERRTR